jgi:hypothetical protein
MNFSFVLFVTMILSMLTSSLQAQHQPNCLAPSKELLIQAIRDGELEKAHKMIESGRKLNVSDECGAVPLLEAIRWSNRAGYDKFVLELLSSGADPKYPGGGAEALASAAFMCNTTIARELLKRGVPVNAANVIEENRVTIACASLLEKPFKGSSSVAEKAKRRRKLTTSPDFSKWQLYILLIQT